MFSMSIFKLASAEQKQKWQRDIKYHKWLGCYAQTELGHGSNVAGMETTAKLDKTTDEFIIHSPTISSTKFWPGDLGRQSTHAIVFARCQIDNKDHGVHPFLVQLRDVSTFKHFKGVTSGDLGSKFGYNSKDNGWARFDNVRIPRTDMLMGFAKVDKSGNFSLQGDMRALYMVMMTIRLMIVKGASAFLFTSIQIALRYNCVRRQFKTLH